MDVDHRGGGAPPFLCSSPKRTNRGGGASRLLLFPAWRSLRKEQLLTISESRVSNAGNVEVLVCTVRCPPNFKRQETLLLLNATTPAADHQILYCHVHQSSDLADAPYWRSCNLFVDCFHTVGFLEIVFGPIYLNCMWYLCQWYVCKSLALTLWQGLACIRAMLTHTALRFYVSTPL